MPFIQFFKKTNKGFALVEVAIAMAVVGMIVGISLPLLSQMMKHQRAKTTENNMQAVIRATASYVGRSGTLPCPAQMTTDESQKGVAPKTCSRTQGITGMVPYKTLGIPLKLAKDGYGNWLSFAVNPKLVLSASDRNMDDTITQSYCKAKQTIPELRVMGVQGQSVIAPQKDDYCALVVISHGPSGSGALTDAGNRLPTQQADKTTNADPTGDFVDGDITVDFDDRLMWVSRDNLLNLYGQKPCLR